MGTRVRVAVVSEREPKVAAVRQLLQGHYGVEALDIRAATEPSERDALVIDLQHGDILRLQRLERIRTARPSLPVVALLDDGHRGALARVREAGADEVLAGSLQTRQRLTASLQRLIARRRCSVGPTEGEWRLGRLIGASPPMLKVYGSLRSLAAMGTRHPVLITGETGTGKELAARELNRLDQATEPPFVPVNCTAGPDSLQDDFLFGHRRGGFSGAEADYKGCFARAEGGSLLLDEIGETPPSFQTKLLRVLEERSYTPIGGSAVEEVRCRVILSTNRRLEAEVQLGGFREDLFQRIKHLHVHIPPLRERTEDLPLLINAFMRRFNEEFGRSHWVPDDVLRRVEGYDWPGNVRELRGLLLGAFHKTPQVEPVLQLPSRLTDETAPMVEDTAEKIPTWAEFQKQTERQYFQRIIDAAGGNQSEAARLAGMHRTQLRRNLKKLGLLPTSGE